VWVENDYDVSKRNDLERETRQQIAKTLRGSGGKNPRKTERKNSYLLGTRSSKPKRGWED